MTKYLRHLEPFLYGALGIALYKLARPYVSGLFAKVGLPFAS